MRAGLRVASAMILLTLCVGCGGLSDVLGSYEGTSTSYNATNFGMVTESFDDVVTVTPIEESEDVWVGVSARCAVRATVDDLALSVGVQSCTWRGPNSTDTWTYQGTGSVSESGTLMLNLTGTFSRVYDIGPLMTPPLEGNHKLDFSGQRQ